jgi:hypothetical protein
MLLQKAHCLITCKNKRDDVRKQLSKQIAAEAPHNQGRKHIAAQARDSSVASE